MRFASSVAWVSAASSIAAATASAAGGGLNFATAFATKGEPAYLHATVLFIGGGGVHRMELWRDHERRLLRNTDKRVTTLATRTGAGGYDLLVLDYARRTSTRISRDNLYRIGQFSDWDDLGHGLRHPRTAYRLTFTRVPVPATLPATPRPCRWFDLIQGGDVSHICWSASDRFPLLITTSQWQPVWRAMLLDNSAILSTRFGIDDRGYVRNDANQDVAGD